MASERAGASRSPTAPSVRADEESVLVAFGGDVNFGRKCGQRLLVDADFDPLRSVQPLWRDADLRFVNLEAPLSDQRGETQSPHHDLVFTGPPAGADALARAGVGMVSTANNHSWDYGRRGMFETLANLDRAGVQHAGTGVDEAAAYRPAIVDVRSAKVALFAVTQVWNLGVFEQEQARHHVAWADPARLRDAVMRARREADFVLLSYHGGEEYTEAPFPRARAFVAEMMSLGVDAVIGHHPHVMQGVAWFESRPVFYSLGNLVFDARSDVPGTARGMIAKLRLRRGYAAEAVVCPIVIDGYEPRALRPNEVESRRAFVSHLRAISQPLGGSEFGARDEAGCFSIRPTHDVSPRRDRRRADPKSPPIARR